MVNLVSCLPSFTALSKHRKCSSCFTFWHGAHSEGSVSPPGKNILTHRDISMHILRAVTSDRMNQDTRWHWMYILLFEQQILTFDLCPQATAPVSIPSSCSNGSACTSFTPNNSSSFSISWQSPPVTFTGNMVRKLNLHAYTEQTSFHLCSHDSECVRPLQVSPSKSQGFGEQRSQTIAALSSPPRAATALRYWDLIWHVSEKLNIDTKLLSDS